MIFSSRYGIDGTVDLLEKAVADKKQTMQTEI